MVEVRMEVRVVLSGVSVVAVRHLLLRWLIVAVARSVVWAASVVVVCHLLLLWLLLVLLFVIQPMR